MEDKFKTSEKITWCKGCGNFGILAALNQAFSKLNLEPWNILATYGIGCHGHMVNYLKTFGFEGLHGRAIPLAVGAKIANDSLNVFAFAGDGDLLGEGGNHFLHASKRNNDINCILHNNQIYSLTVGQTSPTSEKGIKTKSNPKGATDDPLKPSVLAITSGATFVARGFSGDIDHLAELITKAVQHKGFSFIEVLQPCVTLNPINTFDWYRQRVYKLDDINYNSGDKLSALEKSLEWGSKIPIGILYQINKPVFEEQYKDVLKNGSLFEKDINNIEINELVKEFN